MSDIFSTQISYETRNIALPNNNSSSSDSNDDAALQYSMDHTSCIISSNKYGYIITGYNNYITRTYVPSIETATDTFQAFKLSQSISLLSSTIHNMKIQGLSLSYDELILAVQTNICILLYKITDITSNTEEHPRVDTSNQKVKHISWSKNNLLLCVLSEVAITIYNEQGLQISASSKYQSCSHLDWTPNQTNNLCLVRDKSIIILNQSLQELSSFSPEISTEFFLQFNFISWVCFDDCDYFILGCECVIHNDNDDDDGDEEEEEFVSIQIIKYNSLSAPTNIGYFEDICQNLKSSNYPQILYSTCIQEMHDVFIVSNVANSTVLLHFSPNHPDSECCQIFPADEKYLTLPVGPGPSYTKSSALGICHSLSASETVFSVDKTFSPRPMLFMLSSSGSLQISSYVNREYDESICYAPQSLPSAPSSTTSSPSKPEAFITNTKTQFSMSPISFPSFSFSSATESAAPIVATPNPPNPFSFVSSVPTPSPKSISNKRVSEPVLAVQSTPALSDAAGKVDFASVWAAASDKKSKAPIMSSIRDDTPKATSAFSINQPSSVEDKSLQTKIKSNAPAPPIAFSAPSLFGSKADIKTDAPPLSAFSAIASKADGATIASDSFGALPSISASSIPIFASSITGTHTTVSSESKLDDKPINLSSSVSTVKTNLNSSLASKVNDKPTSLDILTDKKHLKASALATLSSTNKSSSKVDVNNLDASQEFKRSVLAFSDKIADISTKVQSIQEIISTNQTSFEKELQSLVRSTLMETRSVKSIAESVEGDISEATACIASIQDVLRQVYETELILDDNPEALSKSYFNQHKILSVLPPTIQEKKKNLLLKLEEATKKSQRLKSILSRKELRTSFDKDKLMIQLKETAERTTALASRIEALELLIHGGVTLYNNSRIVQSPTLRNTQKSASLSRTQNIMKINEEKKKRWMQVVNEVRMRRAKHVPTKVEIQPIVVQSNQVEKWAHIKSFISPFVSVVLNSSETKETQEETGKKTTEKISDRVDILKAENSTKKDTQTPFSPISTTSKVDVSIASTSITDVSNTFGKISEVPFTFGPITTPATSDSSATSVKLMAPPPPIPSFAPAPFVTKVDDSSNSKAQSKADEVTIPESKSKAPLPPIPSAAPSAFSTKSSSSSDLSVSSLSVKDDKLQRSSDVLSKNDDPKVTATSIVKSKAPAPPIPSFAPTAFGALSENKTVNGNAVASTKSEDKVTADPTDSSASLKIEDSKAEAPKALVPPIPNTAPSVLSLKSKSDDKVSFSISSKPEEAITTTVPDEIKSKAPPPPIPSMAPSVFSVKSENKVDGVASTFTIAAKKSEESSVPKALVPPVPAAAPSLFGSKPEDKSMIPSYLSSASAVKANDSGSNSSMFPQHQSPIADGPQSSPFTAKSVETPVKREVSWGISSSSLFSKTEPPSASAPSNMQTSVNPGVFTLQPASNSTNLGGGSIFNQKAPGSAFNNVSSPLFAQSTAPSTSTPVTQSSDNSSINRLSLEAKVRNFYSKHNPSKMDEIPVLLDKYKGREGELVEKLEKKYNSKMDAEVPSSLFGGGFGGGNTFAQLAQSSPAQSSSNAGQTSTSFGVGFPPTGQTLSQSPFTLQQTSISHFQGTQQPVFGQTTPVFGQTTPVFGQTAPVFGQTTPSFGQTTPLFGQAGSGLQSGSTPFTPAFVSPQSQATSGTAFLQSSAGRSQPAFGQTSAFGASSSLGQPSVTGGASSFGSGGFGSTAPTFGQTSGLGGGNQFVARNAGSPFAQQPQQSSGVPFAQQSSGSPFGQVSQSSFGQRSSTGTSSLFGQNGAVPSTPLFGQQNNNAPSFGMKREVGDDSMTVSMEPQLPQSSQQGSFTSLFGAPQSTPSSSAFRNFR